jgi:hypothetical protein
VAGKKPIVLIMITATFFCMKIVRKTCLIVYAFLLLVIVLVFPVSAVVASAATATPASVQSASAVGTNPMISGTVSVATPTVGDPVTISGAVTSSTPITSAQIWIFAGSYIDVSTVQVNTDGTYSKTFQTSGFPPATYYVFVQSPGNDGKFSIALDKSGKYSGQVVDTKDGSLLVNMTGKGSVQDSAAAVALTEALNKRSGDDVYTKTTFQLVAPTTSAPIAAVTTASAVPIAPTKSPLSLLALFGGLGLCGVAFRLSRK